MSLGQRVIDRRYLQPTVPLNLGQGVVDRRYLQSTVASPHDFYQVYRDNPELLSKKRRDQMKKDEDEFYRNQLAESQQEIEDGSFLEIPRRYLTYFGHNFKKWYEKQKPDFSLRYIVSPRKIDDTEPNRKILSGKMPFEELVLYTEDEVKNMSNAFKNRWEQAKLWEKENYANQSKNVELKNAIRERENIIRQKQELLNSIENDLSNKKREVNYMQAQNELRANQIVSDYRNRGLL